MEGHCSSVARDPTSSQAKERSEDCRKRGGQVEAATLKYKFGIT